MPMTCTWLRDPRFCAPRHCIEQSSVLAAFVKSLATTKVRGSVSSLRVHVHASFFLQICLCILLF